MTSDTERLVKRADLHWNARILWRELDCRGVLGITVPMIQSALQAAYSIRNGSKEGNKT